MRTGAPPNSLRLLSSPVPQPVPLAAPPPSPWFEVVWTRVSLYKKLMMHLKEHCSYVTLGVGPTEGLTFTGSSAIDHLCLRVHLPPRCFHELRVVWPNVTDRVELNMYTLYSIMKKATAFRHERVRVRVAWQPQGYYAVTVTFETVNKSEWFHMRGAKALNALRIPRPDITASGATLNPTLLADAFKRFDMESFRTVTLSVHVRTEDHPHTVTFEPVHDTLTLRGRTDSMQGKVYIPYWTMTGDANLPLSTPSSTKYRYGNFLLASLRSVTRFASLAQPRQLTLRQVDVGDPTAARPLCMSFVVSDYGTVACYLPPMAPDATRWSYGAPGDTTSSEEDDEHILKRVYSRHSSRDRETPG